MYYFSFQKYDHFFIKEKREKFTLEQKIHPYLSTQTLLLLLLTVYSKKIYEKHPDKNTEKLTVKANFKKQKCFFNEFIMMSS